MPGIDGFHLARHIREKYTETDVIFDHGIWQRSKRSMP
jgi:hypothetical protein